MAMFERSTKSAKGFDWAGLGWLFLFFWYFSGITQLLIQLSGTSGFSGFRQAFFMSAIWLAPLLVFPRRTRVLAALIGVVLWACSMASLGYFFIYQQEFSQSVIFIMFESNISEAGEYATQYFAWWIVLAFIAHTAFAVFLWTRLRPVYLPRGQSILAAAAIVLAVVEGGKVQLAAGVTADSVGRLKAGELVNFVAQQVGGKGGGKPDMAMAGGTDAAALPKALASVQGWVAERA